MAVTLTQIKAGETNYPEFKPEVIEAMEEAKQISQNPDIKGYNDIDEFFKELEA